MVCLHSDISSYSILFLIFFSSLRYKFLSQPYVLHPLRLLTYENLDPSALQERHPPNEADRRLSLLLSLVVVVIIILMH